jgi:glutathione synthase/RimK-type ligase-like ATP-grasp enzyme
MAKAVHIWAYNENSEGAKNLSRFTGFKRIKHQGSTYKPGPDKIILNWGDSKNFPPAYRQSLVLNSPNIVGAMTNKLKFFELMSETDVNIPEWTTNSEEALRWQMEDPKVIIVCRTVLTGHSGDGIILYNHGDGNIPRAPLYTKYVPKKEEYRVHFFDGKVIDTQQKKKRLDFEGEANFKVRNHQNGFVYCRGGVAPPRCVVEQAEKVIKACGLDFGAIDIIYNEKKDEAFVLEVNTAPGLEGLSVEVYAKAIKEYVGG